MNKLLKIIDAQRISELVFEKSAPRLDVQGWSHSNICLDAADKKDLRRTSPRSHGEEAPNVNCLISYDVG